MKNIRDGTKNNSEKGKKIIRKSYKFLVKIRIHTLF